ncbi:unnamed protein product, partial [Symbiodinium sp. KB8]
AAMRANAQALQEQRQQFESLLQEQQETCARMLQEQREIQEATVEAAMRANALALQEQRQHFEGLLEVERRCTELEHDRRQQVEEKLALALELKEEALAAARKISEAHEQKVVQIQEQKDFREAALEAAARDHAQILQEQRQHFEGLLEAERRCTELEHGRRHQVEEKLATALE